MFVVFIIIIIFPSKARLKLKITQECLHVNTPILSNVHSQDKLQVCLMVEHNLTGMDTAW